MAQSRRFELADISREHVDVRAGISHAVAYLESLLQRWRKVTPRGQIDQQMRRDLPYVIHKTSVEHTYILVNRDYKPIGSTASDFVRYEDYPNCQLNLTREQIERVVSPGYTSGLFGDGDPPWASKSDARAYLARLQTLLTYA
ncbi:MAG: hypothetical protein ACXWCY_26880 [Burkholderiales bacterium]